MKQLPLTLSLMKETNLPVTDVHLEGSKVLIDWDRSPEQHEKELAQRCAMFNTVVHRF